MSRGTKKVGRAGRFGPRYGTSVRRRVTEIERKQFKPHACPECLTGRLKRVSTSIWECRKCDHKFAGGAYMPRTTAFGKAKASAEALAAVEEEYEEALEEEAAEPEPTPVPATADEAEEESAEEPAEPDEAEPEPEPASEEPEIDSLFE